MQVDKKFLEICKKFNENRVEYIVCGAYACKLHGIEKISGQQRFTNDYDFIVDPSEENIKKIKRALKKINPDVKDLHNDDLKKYRVIKIVGEAEIDLIAKLWQIDYKIAIDDAVIKGIQGIKIPVLSLDKLIETKINSFRERDKADVYWLKKLKKKPK